MSDIVPALDAKLEELKKSQELVDAQVALQRSMLQLDDPKLMRLPDPDPFDRNAYEWPAAVKAYILCALECGFSLLEIAMKLGLTVSSIYTKFDHDARFRKMYLRSRRLQLETLKDFVLQNVKTMDADNYRHVRAQSDTLIKLIETLDLELASAKGGKSVEIILKPYVSGPQNP